MSNEAKIKVLLIGPGPPLVGGQAVQAKRLLDKLEKEEGVEAGFLPVNPVFLPFLQRIKYVRTFVTTLRYLVSLIANIPKYDVIHIFSASFTSFLLAPAPAILVSKLFRKKAILNYRSGFAEEHLRKGKRTVIPLIGMCELVVAPSKYLVDVFGKFDIHAEYVFNFVDTQRFGYRLRSQLEPRFLSNRNFENLYNVECTIRAFAIVQNEYPEASLILAGGGPLESKLKTLINGLDLSGVQFTGLVSQDEMAELYDSSDIYLNSPDVDNMPNSIIEAFASGLAVVSTNAGGIPYIVEHEHNGLLVEIGDHEALAVQAMRLIREPELAQRVIEGGKLDLEKYDWQAVRKGWLNIYRTVYGKPGSKA